MNTGEQRPPPTIQSINASGNASGPREEDKIQLVLAYLFPLSLIPLLTVKDSPFVRWHAKQGLVLGLLSTVISFALAIILIGPCLGFGLFVVGIVAMVKALRGERWRIPVVADLADKF